jgi:beta-catenin-like protein 1
VEQRAKHSDEPQRFLESELELDEAVRGMTVRPRTRAIIICAQHRPVPSTSLPADTPLLLLLLLTQAVATSPELYPDLVAAGVVPTLLALLHHDNGDIAAAGLELLAELTDADAVEDSEEEAGALVDALLAGGLLQALASRLGALDERVPEEAAAVHHALAVVENAVELRAGAAEAAATATPLLEWVLARLGPRAPVDANKQYAAEVLALVLQAGGDAARRRFAALDGVDRALQAAAPYRARDAASAEEEEFVENVFNALCVALLLPEARRAFVAAEGVELMALVLRGRRASRTAALKCLDFATSAGYSPACDRLVDQGGLKTVFALLMGKLKARGRRVEEAALAEEEERSVSVVANLMAGVTGAARRERVAAKFVENEFEKCDRLMEVFFRYEARVAAAAAARGGQGQGGGEGEGEDALLARLGAGLFTLQRCALVAATLWACGDAGARRRLLALLHQRGRSLGALRGVLVEYRDSLGGEAVEAGDEEGAARRAQQVDDVAYLLAALGHAEDAAGEGGGEGDGEGAAAGNDAAAAGAPPSADGAAAAAGASAAGGDSLKRRRSGDGGGDEDAPQRQRVE